MPLPQTLSAWSITSKTILGKCKNFAYEADHDPQLLQQQTGLRSKRRTIANDAQDKACTTSISRRMEAVFTVLPCCIADDPRMTARTVERPAEP